MMLVIELKGNRSNQSVFLHCMHHYWQYVAGLVADMAVNVNTVHSQSAHLCQNWVIAQQ